MWYNVIRSGVMLVGETDLTEKQLFELEDVFADIVNVLLLDGKPLILPEELTPAKKDSLYKDKELKVRMQERDIAKLWTQGNIRMAFFGLEDQTAIDYDMPPMPGNVKHLKELLDLFNAVTKDNRFIEMYQKSKGEVNDMSCVALDYLAEEYKVKWRNDGINEGKELERLSSIRSLMKSLNFTGQQAMDALYIPQEERKRYVDKI